MNTSEIAIQAGMTGIISHEEADLATAIAWAVEQKIFCNVTREILDSRTAIAVQLWADPGSNVIAGDRVGWHTFDVVGAEFMTDEWADRREGARARMSAAYGVEGTDWRWVDAREIWKKIDSQNN